MKINKSFDNLVPSYLFAKVAEKNIPQIQHWKNVIFVVLL